METYDHKQVSPWLLLLLFAVAGAVAVALAVSAPLLAIPVLILIVVLAFMFSAMSTHVDRRGVSWAFTLGFPSGMIPFADIGDVEITKTHFWEGYGIHWTIWHGWLWNVGGYRGVMIRKRSGGRITLGTDDPQGLYDAIARLRT